MHALALSQRFTMMMLLSRPPQAETISTTHSSTIFLFFSCGPHGVRFSLKKVVVIFCVHNEKTWLEIMKARTRGHAHHVHLRMQCVQICLYT
jgi:hypothetical protein